MGGWWSGTRLVWKRGLVENVRSKTFRVVMAVLLLLSVAAVTLPQLLVGSTPTYTLATVGSAPPDMVAALDAAQRKGDFAIEYLARSGPGEVRAAVRVGDATVGLADHTLYTAADGAGTFPVVVAQAVVSIEVAEKLARAGLTARQVADLQSIQPPTQITVSPATPSVRGKTWADPSPLPASQVTMFQVTLV